MTDITDSTKLSESLGCDYKASVDMFRLINLAVPSKSILLEKSEVIELIEFANKDMFKDNPYAQSK